MEIKIGDKFRCIKTVYMMNLITFKEDNAIYIKDKVYTSEVKNCITDEEGNIYHFWREDDAINKHFVLIERTTEKNSFLNENMTWVNRIDDLKPGDKIWRINPVKNDFEILQFLSLNPNRKSYAIFLDYYDNGNAIQKRHDPDFVLESWFRFDDSDECWASMYYSLMCHFEKRAHVCKEAMNEYIKLIKTDKNGN